MNISVPRRTLGCNGPVVSAIGLGCMGMSAFYGPAEHSTNLAVLNHAIDIGVNFWDTAESYGPNEQLLGEVLRSRRTEVVLATKFSGRDGRPEYVRSACEASLKRLGVEEIDLYFQHRVDPKVPIEETIGAMARLVEAGKVKHLGVCEVSADTVRRAARVHRIAALQTEYSLWTRDVEQGVLAAIRDCGIGLVAYSPLGRGFLTGAIRQVEQLAVDDWRRQNPRFEQQNFIANQQLLRTMTDFARQLGITPAQLALAWLLHQGPEIVPIPGTRQIARLEENAMAAAIRLDEDTLKKLDQAMSGVEVAGARYPAEAMKLVNA